MAEKRSGLGSTLMYSGMLILGIGIFALVMYLFGTRLDYQDPTADEPSNEEVQRQDISVDITRIKNLATALASNDQRLPHSVSEAATQWLTETGGVWVPWPEGAPEGYSNPPLDVEPAEISTRALIEELTALSDAVIGNGALDPSSSVAIATAARQYAYTLAQAAGDNAKTLTAICPTPDLTILGPLLADGVALTNIETAHQWLESEVAQLDISAQELGMQQANEYQLLVEAMLDAGAPDTRPVIVDVPASKNVVASAYDLTAQQLIFSARRASAPERGEVVNFLCTIASYGGMPELPSLPGLTK